MIKTVFKQAAKELKGKLEKLGLEEKLSKHSNYIAKAKEIWQMINEDLGISDTVENKLISKIDKFEKALLSKFPELTKDDVTEIKQSIVEESNVGKDSDDIKRLQEENEKLKNQLSNINN